MPGSHAFDESGNAVWGTTSIGDLIAVRLYDRSVHPLGSGYTDPIAALPVDDGLRLVVVEAAGAVLVAHRDSADRAQAGEVATIPGGALAAATHPDSGLILILAGPTDDGRPSRLVSCALDTGVLDELGDAEDGVSVAVDATTRQALVLCRRADGSGALTVVDLAGGSQLLADGLTAYTWLAPAPAGYGPGWLTTDADRLVLLDPAGLEITDESFTSPPEGLTAWGSLVLTTTGTQVHGVEWDLDGGELPLDVPLGPLYVSGYARVAVDLPAFGLSVADVQFSVREGPEAGSVSLGVTPPGPDGALELNLVAGIRPGEHHLEVTATADGKTLATRRFRVTRVWPDDASGPPVAVTGNRQAYLMSWGGTGGTAGYLAKAAPEEWHVLAVMVELKGRGWGGLEVGARVEWKDRLVGGGESARTFYEEASAYKAGSHGTTIRLVGDAVQGPVSVDAAWADVFKVEDFSDKFAGWTTKSTGWSVLAGAISDYFADLPGGAALMDEADTILVVVRSGSDVPVPIPFTPTTIPTLYTWGHASGNEVPLYRKTPTLYTQFALKLVVMTDHYPAGAPTRNPTYTLSHELGHTLGLADLYNDKHYVQEVVDRLAGAVDIMASSQAFAHFSLANRIRLGWVNRNSLRRFDFAADPNGDTVTLQAAETLTGGGATAGRMSGIEVPITDDWSYLFEYRREQPGQVGDQRLDTTVVAGADAILVGTDLRARGGETARPPILALPVDVDGDGPLLTLNGTDYRDDDTTNKQRTYDFTATLQAIRSPDANSARVKVTYLAAHRPQLQVSPAPGAGNYKSPDIDLIGPHGDSVPYAVKGAPNTIRVTVHNLGSADARKAQIHVKWLPFAATPGSWELLDDPSPFDVPAGGATTVAIRWDIPASVLIDKVEVEHFCVRVDIDRYTDAAHPGDDEIVVHDNWAQSNFDTKPVPAKSPSQRITTVVLAANTLGRPATYQFGAHQSTDWYRVYLGHAWLQLEPDETRAMELAYESLAEDPLYGDDFAQNIEKITSTDHDVAIVSSVLPEASECQTPRELFGAGLRLRAGHGVEIDEVEHHGELVRARVRSVSDGSYFPVTFGEFHLAAWPVDDPDRLTRSVGSVTGGTGRVLLDEEVLRYLRDDVRVAFCLCRPGDNWFSAAFTAPTVFE